MRYRYLYTLIIALIYGHSAAAQSSKADSVWCDDLRNIIRCVSMAQIYEPVGPPSADTFDIAPFAPHIHLTGTDRESMQRKYKKVTYSTDLQSTSGTESHAALAMDQWYGKFHLCLEGWDIARIANRDTNCGVKDYFITNSEDETTIRLSLLRDSAFSDSYHVRITIY